MPGAGCQSWFLTIWLSFMISIVLSRRIVTDVGWRPGRVRTLRQMSCHPNSESM
jgi:hypothetical protein